MFIVYATGTMAEANTPGLPPVRADAPCPQPVPKLPVPNASSETRKPVRCPKTLYFK